MKIKSVTEFHEQAPKNATHVLKLGDKYEYANFTGYNYDSCDNSTPAETFTNAEAANNDWFYRVGKGDWEVHLKLCAIRH